MRTFVLALLLLASHVLMGAEESAAETSETEKSQTKEQPAQQQASKTREWPLWDGKESVEEYAERTKLPSLKIFDLGKDVKLTFVLIPAGNFTMGMPTPNVPVKSEGIGIGILLCGGIMAILCTISILVTCAKKKERPQFSLKALFFLFFSCSTTLFGYIHWSQAKEEKQTYELACIHYAKTPADEKPEHQVCINRPFYLSKFETTQEQYTMISGINPSQNLGTMNPVDDVTWEEASQFCRKLGAQLNAKFRLPTEAEWEFSCRAGESLSFLLSTGIGEFGWIKSNSNKKTNPVGLKKSNLFGLHDMHGNVYEWCQDWYSEDYYACSPKVNPLGPDIGDNRVIRGTSYESKDANSGSSPWTVRGSAPPSFRGACEGIGFRVLLPIELELRGQTTQLFP